MFVLLSRHNVFCSPSNRFQFWICIKHVLTTCLGNLEQLRTSTNSSLKPSFRSSTLLNSFVLLRRSGLFAQRSGSFPSLLWKRLWQHSIPTWAFIASHHAVDASKSEKLAFLFWESNLEEERFGLSISSVNPLVQTHRVQAGKGQRFISSRLNTSCEGGFAEIFQSNEMIDFILGENCVR